MADMIDMRSPEGINVMARADEVEALERFGFVRAAEVKADKQEGDKPAPARPARAKAKANDDNDEN